MLKKIFLYFWICCFFFNANGIIGKSAKLSKIDNNYISLDFEKIDIRDLIIKLNDLAKTNYLIPNNLRGNISIVSPRKVHIKQIPKILENILKINGFATIVNDSFTTITPISNAKNHPTSILDDSQQIETNKVIIKFVKIKYYSSIIISNTVRQILSSNVKIILDNNQNDLIIVGFGDEVEKVVKIINLIDVPDKESRFLIYKLKNTSAAVLSTKILQVINALNSQKKISLPIRIIPDEINNQLIVVTSKKNFEYVENLLSEFDKIEEINDVTKVFILQNIDVKGISKTIKDLLSSNYRFKNLMNRFFLYEDFQQNALVVSGNVKLIFEYIEDYIKKIDQKFSYKDRVIKVFPIKYSDEKIVYENLKKLLPYNDKVLKEKLDKTSIIADERQHAIIVSTYDKEIMDQIEKILLQLDKDSNSQKSNIHIYKLQNTSAENVAGVLSKLSVIDEKTNKPVQIPVSFDKSTNSVVLTASSEQYVQIKKIIEEFDKEKAQVLIKVLIAEITDDGTEKLGVDWLAAGSLSGEYTGGAAQNFSGNLTEKTILDKLDEGKTKEAARSIAALEGFNVGIFKNNIGLGAILNLVKQMSNFNVLSTPEILTEDNNEAEIIVGEKVPFITSSRTSGDNDATTNSFEYENIGINLKITPHVNNSNKVTLDIDQEIKNLLEKKLYTEEIPLTSNRQIKTKITIDDNQVVMIGGLIKKTINKNKSSIPFLGKIPLLGKLFQRTTENEVKTNLVVIISPKIIRKIENSAIEVSDEDKRFINKNSYPKLKNIFKSTNDNK